VAGAVLGYVCGGHVVVKAVGGGYRRGVHDGTADFLVLRFEGREVSMLGNVYGNPRDFVIDSHDRSPFVMLGHRWSFDFQIP
jgi:hypothetical protein